MYKTANAYYQEKFGCKIYKLSLDGGFTCPNRDGCISNDGCIFCSELGSGEFAEHGADIRTQLELAKRRVERKIKGGKYIAYFQSFTNTYAPVEQLKSLFYAAIEPDYIVGLNIATRPDCLPDSVIELLKELNAIKPVTVELGLQTADDRVAEYINRGYRTEVYADAVTRLKQAGLEIITHIIIGLPSDDPLPTTDFAVSCGTDGVKFHLLHILKHTRLAAEYESGNVKVLSLEEYAEILKNCIDLLPKHIVVHRITGDGAKKDLIAPLWSADKKNTLNYLNAYLQRRTTSVYRLIAEKHVIDRGWSGDQKYCAVTKDGCKYLLRISPLERFERKKREYERMKEVAALKIPMCRPVEFGVCEEGVYSIQTWIDGNDAEEQIVSKTVDEQYRYGIYAGRILAKIHTIPAPVDVPDWESCFNAKIDRKIAMYEACELKYEYGGEEILQYIAQNRHLLRGRPQSYQHGDYHIGNMMLSQNGVLHIIDFDRDDYGDPWEEFNRIVWCAQAAPSFACGMVDGYFNGNVPMEFWQLLALYICSNTLGSLPWAIPFGEGEIQIMRKQAAQMLRWYDGMRRVVPSWYRYKEKL